MDDGRFRNPSDYRLYVTTIESIFDDPYRPMERNPETLAVAERIARSSVAERHEHKTDWRLRRAVRRRTVRDRRRVQAQLEERPTDNALAAWKHRLLAAGRADRDAAERAVKAAYRRVDRDSPRIEWADSPRALVATARTQPSREIFYEAVGEAATSVYQDTWRFQNIMGRWSAASELLERVWEAALPGRVKGLRLLRDVPSSLWMAGFDHEWYEEYPQAKLASHLANAWYLRTEWSWSAGDKDFLFDLVANCGGFVLYDGLALLSERHTVFNGYRASRPLPTMSWDDGFAIYNSIKHHDNLHHDAYWG